MEEIREVKLEPFHQYMLEDKSIYPLASTCVNPKTGRYYIDPYNYFRVGESGGFLLNIEFTFENTTLLNKVGKYFEKNNTYNDYDFESIEYDKFRLREEHRREHGFIAKCRKNRDTSISNLYISGAYYNFLNYGYIKKLDRTTTKYGEKPKKKMGLPEFMDSQFWWFAVKEFSEQNGFNRLALKSRRKGCSFMEGTDTANCLNLNRNTVCVHVAYDTKYLTKAGAITRMAEAQLKHYEEHTPFKRCPIDESGKTKGFASKVIEEIVLGYKDKSGTLRGWQSTLFSTSTSNTPDVLVGKDATLIKCDELNTFPNFTEFMQMGNPTTTTGAFKTGWISAFGTGGTKDSNWGEFKKHYFETSLYDFMPFENVWDENSRGEKIGYFYPYWWGLEGINREGKWSIDEAGNSNYHVSIELSDEERKYKLQQTGATSDYFNHTSQYCNRPFEAFGGGGERMFSSLELRTHIKSLQSSAAPKFYKDGILEHSSIGRLKFTDNTELLNRGDSKFVHPYIMDVPHKNSTDTRGCFRMYYSPFKDYMTGIIPDNLYFTTYDTVGANKDKDDVTDKHSLACVQVWMYPNNISNSSGRILVATWVGRCNSTREDDIEALKISDYYNAKCLAEMNRGTMMATCKELNRLNILLPDPTEVTQNTTIGGRKSNSYGMILNEANKLDGLLHLKDLMYLQTSTGDNDTTIYQFQYVYDIPFLLELDKYSYKGNFDRISTALLAAHQINKYVTIRAKAKPVNKEKGRLADIMNNS